MNTKSYRLTPPDTYPANRLAADVRFAVAKLNQHGGLVFTSFTVAGRFSLLLRGKPAAMDTVKAGLIAFGWSELRQPPEVSQALEVFLNYKAEVETAERN